MPDAIYDVVIVGGGLAGCAAAIPLSQAGYRVAVLEAGDYPRHRVCGEFLSPETLTDFAALGVLEAVQAHRPPRLTRARVTAPNGTTWEADLPGAALGLSRYALDDLLAERARAVGGRLYTHTRANNVTTGPGGYHVQAKQRGQPLTIFGRELILAYGKRAKLDRTLQRRFIRQQHPYIGLKMHYRGPAIPGRVDMHGIPGGYVGLNEVEDGRVNVCLLVRQEIFRQAGGMPDFVNWMATQNPALGAWLAGAQPLLPRWLSIAQVAFSRKATLYGHALFTGDAAGLIAPLAGNGMAMALAGGRLAAHHMADVLGGQASPGQAAWAYQRAWRGQFAGRLWLGRGLQACLLRPGVLELGLAALNTIPPLGHFVVTRTRGPSIPYPQ